MKVSFLSLIFTALISVSAFANQPKSARDVKAYNVVNALYNAGLKVSDSGDEGAIYHAYSIECDYQRAEGVKVFETCSIYSGPSAQAPVYQIKEMKADALIGSLIAAGATEKFEDNFSLRISNLDGYSSINGPAAYIVHFIDMNK